MAKIVYWLITGGLYGALGHGLDLRGQLGAGLVCWSLAGVCLVAAGFVAWSMYRD